MKKIALFLCLSPLVFSLSVALSQPTPDREETASTSQVAPLSATTTDLALDAMAPSTPLTQVVATVSGRALGTVPVIPATVKKLTFPVCIQDDHPVNQRSFMALFDKNEAAHRVNLSYQNPGLTNARPRIRYC